MKKVVLYLVLLLAFWACEDQNDGAELNHTSSADGQGGSLATFALKGDYLYVVDEFSLNVFDVSQANNPIEVNRVPIGFNIETLFSHQDYLYIGSRNGMYIYSLADPRSPIELSNVIHFTACDPVIANDSIAFVTLHSNTSCGNNVNLLEVYEVNNPRQPNLLHQKALASPKGLGLYDEYLILCDDQIKVYDVSNPSQPAQINSINRNAFDLIIRNQLLIAIGKQGLYQYELSRSPNGLDVRFLSEIAI